MQRVEDDKTIVFAMKNGSEISVQMVGHILRLRSKEGMIIVRVNGNNAINILPENPKNPTHG